MNGRIILSHADFSANNIGQYVELSDLTKKVLAKQTLYSEDSQQAIALNTFLSELTSNGFIGGETPLLKYFALPVLAANNDQLLYSIAELDNDGYPTDTRSDEEKSAATKVYQRYIVDDVVKGLCVQYQSIPSSDFINQQRITVNNFFTKSAAYPSMSVCVWCPKVTVENEALVEIGGGYSFQIRKNYAGLISPNVSTTYLKVPVSNLGAGFIGVSYDASNYQIETMFDTGTAGTLESANPSIIKQTSYNGYNNMLLGNQNNYTNRQFTASAITVGHRMTSTQMTQFKTLLVNFLTSLSVI